VHHQKEPNVSDSKVTIVIPTYNAEDYIYETVDSCLKQTYTNIEVVVIDDVSKDNTPNILKGFQDYIKVVSNNKNQGLPKNINSVILDSDSEYFIYLGHDDLLPSDHVELMLKQFDADTVAVHCNSMSIDAAGNETGLIRNDLVQQNKTANSMVELSFTNFISIIGMMHRTSAFKEIKGWDTRYDLYGEWLYYIRILSVGKIKFTTSSSAFYRIHDNNISKSLYNKDKLKAYYDYKKRCRVLAQSNCTMSILELIKFYRLSVINYVKHVKSLLNR
jgi:alpha-1,3-rhamnosyltransferase